MAQHLGTEVHCMVDSELAGKRSDREWLWRDLTSAHLAVSPDGGPHLPRVRAGAAWITAQRGCYRRHPCCRTSLSPSQRGQCAVGSVASPRAETKAAGTGGERSRGGCCSCLKRCQSGPGWGAGAPGINQHSHCPPGGVSEQKLNRCSRNSHLCNLASGAEQGR